ncbi:MAG: hypothetical protein LBS06_00540 [Treponema sp.]|nr:hypothetical protein [Treponema sp.]
MLTFECQSEVVEFYANFEGEKKMFGDTRQLSLLKTSGGTGGSNAAATNAGPAPVFNITVDNSSSNTSTSSGNTSTSSNTTTTIDDSVVGD